MTVRRKKCSATEERHKLFLDFHLDCTFNLNEFLFHLVIAPFVLYLIRVHIFPTITISNPALLHRVYLSPQQCENAGAILQSLESKGISISLRTYYVHRDEAIEVLSSILWGYTSQDCEKITNLLTPD